MKPREVLDAANAVWRTFGWRGLAERATFEMRRRAGSLRATPAVGVEAMGRSPIPDEWPFRPDVRRVRESTDQDAAVARALRVLAGEHQAYRWTWCPRPRDAAQWITHPRSGFRYGEESPWWKVPHFDSRAGDIKDVWEAARFAWAFDLARGWIITGDDGFVRALRTGIETFLRSSPPFHGPHWACGQETAIRAVAWLWAEGACHDAPSFDGNTRQHLLAALAWSGERIVDAFAYARSQRNNHGLSEATGLIAIGARMRDVDPRGEQWIDRGRRALERMIVDQIAPDGWYIQHSFTYARLALDQLTVARRALRVVGCDLSARARERVRAMVDLMAACIDAESGDLPNHGPNDGAYVLPLSTRPYRDFRPSLTAAAATFDATLPESIVPDAETLAWLGGVPPGVRAAPAVPWIRTGRSGWAMAATEGARLFVRAGRYRSRPGHIDPGHVDIWIRGRPAAIDAGTYRYSDPPPWNNGLASIDVHNTVSITGVEAARRGPRFLWLRWPRASIVTVGTVGEEVSIVIRNDSWRRSGISHHRQCRIGAGGVLIIDEVRGSRHFAFPVHVHWLLGDGAEVSVWSSEQSARSEVEGDDASTRGWVAESYGTKRPARSVRVTGLPRLGKLTVASAFGTFRESAPAQHALNVAETSCST